MEKLNFPRPANFRQDNLFEIDLSKKSIEDRVRFLILRDLIMLNWDINIKRNNIEVVPPQNYNKEIVRESMAFRRSEIISKNRSWINKNIDLARSNLASGYSVIKSEIIPCISVCKTQEDFDLFRLLRYYWSSPYSDYVGRRIKLIIRDVGLPSKPIIGIAALGSPIIHIPERDNYIGWNKLIRTRNLVKTMDLYVLGAVPPYNLLLGGKLISYLIASNELRRIYNNKYRGRRTLISNIISNQLIGLFTTSLYGRSSQYNRIKYNNRLLYTPIGDTLGYGSLHLSDETFMQMRLLLETNKIYIGHNFGEGPNWRVRLIRTAADLLGFNSDLLLKHSFRRSIYFVELAKNSKEILVEKEKRPQYYDNSISELTEYWRTRWLNQRKTNISIIDQVVSFNPTLFDIQ